LLGKASYASWAPDDEVIPTNPQLIKPVVASPKDAVMQRYGLVEGTLGVGDMAA